MEITLAFGDKARGVPAGRPRACKAQRPLGDSNGSNGINSSDSAAQIDVLWQRELVRPRHY